MSQDPRSFSHIFIPAAASSGLPFYKAEKGKMAFVRSFSVGFKTLLLYPMSHCPLGQTDLLITAAFFIKHCKGHLLLSFFSSGPNSMPGCSVKSLMNK